jgi:hypothetical protein
MNLLFQQHSATTTALVSTAMASNTVLQQQRLAATPATARFYLQ